MNIDYFVPAGAIMLIAPKHLVPAAPENSGSISMIEPAKSMIEPAKNQPRDLPITPYPSPITYYLSPHLLL